MEEFECGKYNWDAERTSYLMIDIVACSKTIQLADLAKKLSSSPGGVPVTALMIKEYMNGARPASRARRMRLAIKAAGMGVFGPEIRHELGGACISAS